MVNAAFVAPFLLPATVRFVATAAQLPGVRLGLVTTASAEQVPPELARHLAAHWRVDDALDPRQIADAVAGLSRQLGPVERLVGALEQLQVPLAHARDALGIPGMDAATAHARRLSRSWLSVSSPNAICTSTATIAAAVSTDSTGNSHILTRSCAGSVRRRRMIWEMQIMR